MGFYLHNPVVILLHWVLEQRRKREQRIVMTMIWLLPTMTAATRISARAAMANKDIILPVIYRRHWTKKNRHKFYDRNSNRTKQISGGKNVCVARSIRLRKSTSIRLFARNCLQWYPEKHFVYAPSHINLIFENHR